MHSATKLRKTRKHKEEQERIFLLPVELSAIIAHLFPVGLTNAWPTATFLLLFLASPHDKQEEDEVKYSSHVGFFIVL